MTLRALIAPLILLLLSACWTGDPWFTAAESVAAIPDGSYRLAEANSTSETGDRITVKRQPDNSLIVTGPENPWRAIIVPLGDAVANRFVIQLQEQNPQHPTHALFVLLDTSAKKYRVAVMSCTGAAQQAARSSGGRVSSDPQSGPTCIFADRATLLAQLRSVATDDAALDLELVPVRK